MSGPSTLRIAVTLEQCWHRVPGGTARAALDLVDALVAHGPVTVGGETRSLSLIGVSARHRAPAPQPWTPPIAVASLGVPRRVLYETWHRMGWPSVESATGPVDLIHVTGLAMPPPSVPIVATLHDLAFLRDPSQFTRNGMHFFQGALKRMRRDASLVLCSSEATRVDAVAAGFAAEQLRVVPLGVRAESVSPAAVTAARERHGLPERYVLHVGTAEPRKNRRVLLAALPQLPDDVGMVLVGPSGWGATDAESSAALDPRVWNLGFLDEAEKHAVMAGATVFCFPSLWEGFGLPVLEAMSHGTPVVTSIGTAMAEVAGDAALLVDPTDVDAVADALGRLLSDEALAGRLGAAGISVAARYPWSQTAEATIAAYDEVLGRGPGTSRHEALG